MPFACAVSEHPDPAEAAGEVIGAVLEHIGPGCDLMALFVTAHHRAAIGRIANTVRALASPGVLVGSTAVSVLGGAHEIEDRPGVVLWGADLAGRAGFPGLTPARFDAVSTTEGIVITGCDALPDGGHLLLLADPLSFPIEDLLALTTATHPQLTIIGGVASAGFAPGLNRLVLDGHCFDDGAVGVLLPTDAINLETVVSQGCRPIGDPFTVTRAERNVVFEIAGRPALEKLVQLLGTLPEEERQLARSGLHIGRVIDEHKLDFDRGDFLVRNVIGVDHESGAVAVNDVVPLGATVQFQVRDAEAADDDLRALLKGRDAAAALVFTCNGRGIRLFGEPDHDARVITDLTGSRATAGMFCAGEIGPVGGRSFLHGFTASMAIFNDVPHR